MLIKLIIFVLNIVLIYARWEGTVYAHTYSGNSYFIGSTYNCNTMYVCLGQETEGINDGGTDVNPGVMAEYYKLTDCINSKGESAYNQDSKLKNPFKTCSVSKVHVQGPCYNSPDLDHPELEIIHGNGHDTIQYVKTYNGLYLTGWGWCKPYNPPKQQQCTDYGCKRCLRKLPNVKWRAKSNGWTTPLTSGNVNKYCNTSNCKVAYDDKKSKSSRQKYWNKCKNSIYSEFKSYYKTEFTVLNENWP